MKVEKLIKLLSVDFYTGVPDSQLSPLCNYLMNQYGTDPRHHIIAANEGNAVALAAGYHLATGKVPIVYMQNSGEGNAVNPVASLLNQNVYGIPVIFIIGWRGQPGVQDEPQHVFQGEITCRLLEIMDIAYFVIDQDTTEREIEEQISVFRRRLDCGLDVAFVICKGALEYEETADYKNSNEMNREEVIRHITRFSGDDPMISTTGKISRELFETRTYASQSHASDFLTVGSMGHASSIALGVALNQPDKKIWCIDGDGAMLMHMGALTVIGSYRPKNLVHIVINNGAHESVGGLPTVAGGMELAAIAAVCGYPEVKTIDNYVDLDQQLRQVKEGNMLTFLEVKCSVSSRQNLGRPTGKPEENKKIFMKEIRN